MILTEEQRNELEEICKPAVKFLCDNFNPHVKIIIEPTCIEILSASVTVPVTEFVKD